MSRPRVLLMDEPTRGVDVAAKFEILESMRRLAAEGMGIVFATSDLAEVQAVATRVLVMARGRIADLIWTRPAQRPTRSRPLRRRRPDDGGGGTDVRAIAKVAARASLLSLVLRLRALIALVVLSSPSRSCRRSS